MRNRQFLCISCVVSKYKALTKYRPCTIGTYHQMSLRGKMLQNATEYNTHVYKITGVSADNRVFVIEEKPPQKNGLSEPQIQYPSKSNTRIMYLLIILAKKSHLLTLGLIRHFVNDIVGITANRREKV